MKNERLYRRTIDVLVDAYMNDTLRHSICAACAVGNMVACGMSYDLVEINNSPNGIIWRKDGAQVTTNWHYVFMTTDEDQRLSSENYRGYAKREIDSTGYLWQELARIEYAFETAAKGESDDEWMFNGLMNVVDTLDRIHENVDLDVTRISKSRFLKQVV